MAASFSSTVGANDAAEDILCNVAHRLYGNHTLPNLDHMSNNSSGGAHTSGASNDGGGGGGGDVFDTASAAAAAAAGILPDTPAAAAAAAAFWMSDDDALDSYRVSMPAVTQQICQQVVESCRVAQTLSVTAETALASWVKSALKAQSQIRRLGAMGEMKEAEQLKKQRRKLEHIKSAHRDSFRVGFIGCGKMGSRILVSLLQSGVVESSQISVSTRRPELLKDAADAGVLVYDDNRKLASTCKLVVLCVLPHQINAVSGSIRSFKALNRTLDGLRTSVRRIAEKSSGFAAGGRGAARKNRANGGSSSNDGAFTDIPAGTGNGFTVFVSIASSLGLPKLSKTLGTPYTSRTLVTLPHFEDGRKSIEEKEDDEDSVLVDMVESVAEQVISSFVDDATFQPIHNELVETKNDLIHQTIEQLQQARQASRSKGENAESNGDTPKKLDLSSNAFQSNASLMRELGITRWDTDETLLLHVDLSSLEERARELGIS